MTAALNRRCVSSGGPTSLQMKARSRPRHDRSSGGAPDGRMSQLLLASASRPIRHRRDGVNRAIDRGQRVVVGAIGRGALAFEARDEIVDGLRIGHGSVI